MSDDKLILMEDVNAPDSSLALVESSATPKGDFTGAVLAILDGPVADYKVPTRNDREYTEDLYDEVFTRDNITEMIATKNFLGEANHPMTYQNRNDINYPTVSHAIRNLRKVPEEGKWYATFDILDTPDGRVLKTLIDYGTQLGVSSRGLGRTNRVNGRNIVDKSTYKFITFDIVCMPGNRTARLPAEDLTTPVPIEHFLGTPTQATADEITYTDHRSFTESVEYMVSKNDANALKSIKPLLSYLSESEDYKQLTDKAYDIINESSTSTSSVDMTDELLEAYKLVSDAESKLADSNAIIDQLKSDNADLKSKLVEADTKLQDTTSEFEKRIELVNAMNESTSVVDADKYDQLIETNSKLADRVNELSESINQLTIDNADLKSKIDNLKASNQSKFNEALELAKSNRINLAKISNLQRIVESYATEISELTDQRDSYKRDYDNMRVQYIDNRLTNLGLSHDVKLRESLVNGEMTLETMNESINSSYASTKPNKLSDPLTQYIGKSVATNFNESIKSNDSEDNSDSDILKTVKSVRLNG